jgi:uncharacterized membrane protein
VRQWGANLRQLRRLARDPAAVGGGGVDLDGQRGERSRAPAARYPWDGFSVRGDRGTEGPWTTRSDRLNAHGSGPVLVPQALFGALFIVAGVLHFVFPGFYRGIVPPALPNPGLLVSVSGVAEIVGGVAFLMPRWRRLAGLGLILLMVAVFPANVEMLRQGRARGSSDLAQAVLWARLPLQGLLIWWAWRLSRPGRGRKTDSAEFSSDP